MMQRITFPWGGHADVWIEDGPAMTDHEAIRLARDPLPDLDPPIALDPYDTMPGDACELQGGAL